MLTRRQQLGNCENDLEKKKRDKRQGEGPQEADGKPAPTGRGRGRKTPKVDEKDKHEGETNKKPRAKKPKSNELDSSLPKKPQEKQTKSKKSEPKESSNEPMESSKKGNGKPLADQAPKGCATKAEPSLGGNDTGKSKKRKAGAEAEAEPSVGKKAEAELVPAKSRKRKQEEDLPANQKPDVSKAKAKRESPDKPDTAKKVPTTWAGRWIPSCPMQKKRFNAIKKTFETFIQPKVHSQSSFQSPFFKACTIAFHSHDLTDDSPPEDFIAIAEDQIPNFLELENVRSSTVLGSIPNLGFSIFVVINLFLMVVFVLLWTFEFECP